MVTLHDTCIYGLALRVVKNVCFQLIKKWSNLYEIHIERFFITKPIERVSLYYCLKKHSSHFLIHNIIELESVHIYYVENFDSLLIKYCLRNIPLTHVEKEGNLMLVIIVWQSGLGDWGTCHTFFYCKHVIVSSDSGIRILELLVILATFTSVCVASVITIMLFDF